jgi:hypothetical protein
MTQPSLLAIVSNESGTVARLAWISESSGISYCGICLQGQVAPEVNAICSVCDARVSSVFDLASNSRELKQAWIKAFHGANIHLPKGKQNAHGEASA